MQTKIKVLKTNNLFSHKNDISSNNNSNISMMIRTKANSSGYNISQEDLENNKYKFDELYTLYREQNNDNNIYVNKNRTMSNIKPSRNNNYFTIVNKHSNKNNNLSQQNTIININSYLQKNFSSNSLRKNNSNNKKRKKKKPHNINSYLDLNDDKIGNLILEKRKKIKEKYPLNIFKISVIKDIKISILIQILMEEFFHENKKNTLKEILFSPNYKYFAVSWTNEINRNFISISCFA